MVAGVQGSYLSLAVFCVQFLGILQNVGGTGHIDVHFLEYFDACREELPSDKCDPMFTFCLSTPQKGRLNVEGCTYESTGQSADVFGGTNHINMEPLTNIGGIKNPWSVLVQKFNEPSIMLIVRVYDADLFTKDDHMQTWGKTLTETVWPDQDHAKWEERIMSQNAFTMRFKIRMYCDPYYYTTACDKYCKSEDSSSGHYTCDVNGDKICRPGWTGSQCNEDIDECALGFCVRGTCTNTPGDYTCDCPENYTGKNCSYLKNPCREQPCGNGGTCFAHSSEHIYVCQCMPEWDGTNCQLRKPTVCVNNPCLNNGTCSSSSTDKTKYTCTCFGPFTGDNCEIAVTTVQSSLETETTATTPQQTSIRMTIASTTTTNPRDANVQQLKQEEDSGFQLWYIAIIIAILLVVVIVIVILFVRRRRSKAAKSSTPSGPIISYIGPDNDLTFDNGVYASVNRNNSEIDRQNRQLPPVPGVRTQVDGMKSTYAVVDENQGATGGLKPADSEMKKTTPDVQKKTVDSSLGALSRPVNERAQTNPYSDFKTLRDSQVVAYSPTKGHPEDGPYQDLDTVSAQMRGDYDQQDSSDGTFSYIIPDTPIVTVQASPYDSPSNNSSYYDTPKGNMPAPLVPDRTANNDFSPYVNAQDGDSSDDESILQEDILKLRSDVEASLSSTSKS